MRNGKFGFGIVGCGAISKIHAQAIGMLPDAYLVGVSDASAEAAERFADMYGVKAFSDYKSMLLDPEVDVVCVCTPSGLHAEHAMEALAQGKHVVLEKPMALTTEDADRLIEATKRSGRLLTVISQLRFSEDIQKVKKLVEDGTIGRITLASLRMKYYRSREYYSSWKGTKKLDGGGALMNQGIHGVDLFQYLLGPVKNVK